MSHESHLFIPYFIFLIPYFIFLIPHLVFLTLIFPVKIT